MHCMQFGAVISSSRFLEIQSIDFYSYEGNFITEIVGAQNWCATRITFRVDNFVFSEPLSRGGFFIPSDCLAEIVAKWVTVKYCNYEPSHSNNCL